MVFEVLGGIAGQLVMWCVTSRLMYREWYEEEDKLSDEERAGRSAFWGFFWPLAIVIACLGMVCVTVEWSMTSPSLRERKAKKIEVKQARLADLKREIEQAEADLNEATAHAKSAKEDSKPLTRWGDRVGE
jgi:hypothetical protein